MTSLIWSDGAARTPPVLFTYDPKFRNRKISTDRRKAIRSQVDALFEKYSIASFKVFWLGESSCYVPESMELLGFYGAMVDVPPNSVIFHNRGNAFMSQGDSVVPQVFGVKAAVYQPIVHQFLSPNEKRFHVTAKLKWKSLASEKGWGKDDSAESSLALLSFLTHYDSEAVRSYFRENFFLGRASIKPDRCMDLVTNGLLKKIKKSDKFERLAWPFANSGKNLPEREQQSHSLPVQACPGHWTGSIGNKQKNENCSIFFGIGELRISLTLIVGFNLNLKSKIPN